MPSPRTIQSALSLRAAHCRPSSSISRVAAPQLLARPYSLKHDSTNKPDRLQGPAESPSMMQAAKNTIAENVGEKWIPGAHQLAPPDQRFSLDEVPDLSGKVAVVTGGSEGIGYGCAHTLLSHNIEKLFILSRQQDIAQDAIAALGQEMGKDKANRVVWMQCDLSDWEQTSQTAFEIRSKTDRLDMLINNAGRGIMTYQRAEKNGIDLHMATNHFGHVVLTSHLLPLLTATAAAHPATKVRIVQLSSNLHAQAPRDTAFATLAELNTDYGAQPQYARSKLATMLYAKYLDRHLHPAHPNLLSNAVHPGIVETRQSTQHIHEAFPRLGYAMSVGAAPLKKTPLEGCVSAMFAATATLASGQYLCPPAIVEPGSAMANDVALGERLMALTVRVLREKTRAASVDKGCPFALA